MARLKLRTLFRGYGSTVLRDMPFGCIQMPLWEYFKVCWKQHVHHECTPLEGAYCGAASGEINFYNTIIIIYTNTIHYFNKIYY